MVAAVVLEPQHASPSSAGQAIWLFVLLAVIAIAIIMMNRALRRRLHAEVRAAARQIKARRARGADAWAEAGRRVPLEDDPDVPREPPDEPPPQRGFHERR